MQSIVNGIKKIIGTTARVALFLAWSVALAMGGYFKGQNSVYELTVGRTNDAVAGLASLVMPAQAAEPTKGARK